MKLTAYKFKFLGGTIEVRAFNYEQAKILAQAEAIKRAWNYEIIAQGGKAYEKATETSLYWMYLL